MPCAEEISTKAEAHSLIFLVDAAVEEMAAAIASWSRAAAIEAAPAVSIPPASPFAQLLRRSRFASFDPAIRQTYSAPPAHAHKGDWGLKRPIALRRRNAFISLTSFESPAQFIEWNNAESQVRFIRRIEEMDTMPRAAGNTPWYKAVGKGRTQWLADSEFCPGEGHELAEDTPPTVTADLKGLGNRGPGNYGAKRGPPKQKNPSTQDAHVSLNIDAMSPKEFTRYLRTLRELRPAFQAHIKARAEVEKNAVLANTSLYALAQNTEAGYHRRFLQERMSEEFANPKSVKFEQHPHPNAALLYHHPSPLDTRLTTKPKPGFVLNSHSSDGKYTEGKYFKSNKPEVYVANFGGIAAVLQAGNAGGKRPLLDPESEEGIDQSRMEESIVNMRPLPYGLVLQVPPRVVGRQAQGLKAVKIHADVTTDSREAEFGKDNPHPPGSFEYNAVDPPQKRAAPSDFAKPKPKYVAATAWSNQKPGVLQQGTKMAKGGPQLITRLQGMMGNTSWPSGGSAEGL